ncbi:NUDIX hydrolase [Sphingomonas sp.]|uniref:NUDIX hydrolase n=1 Tax=Sphingomonas sp. TaxID=28214 RepID=UPI002C220D91|nr:NUDIX domain-containing protein [Sphingomonas sp.]HWK36782.1 NUDIX domain-containing protein [Sphingomonas sp.]
MIGEPPEPVHTACAIFMRGGRVLLARRAGHKASYPNCWDFVGGHLESGETPEQGLARESMEEVGLLPHQPRPVGLIHDERMGAIYHMFVIDRWAGGEPSLVGEEHTELRWFPIAQAVELPGLALAQYRDLLRTLPSGPDQARRRRGVGSLARTTPPDLPPAA